ncbi:hypothetical protein [Pantoea agglomerans]|uniref:Uncharacterized protein n=1 Tax=Enterobacter agglomerans TaxID=549 RepID=A0A379AE47_ENTAG|nr:hypothetical protein [Pantoea agglomerans]QXB60146.1 hypothetical protein I6L77_08580 [Pantoea agglomerans]SUB15858.1 Uncharacterised protein [Pantoea agglomerans]
MSGSGSFSSGSASKLYSCEVIKFYTNIRSPNPLVVKKLKIGDLLDIDLIDNSICAVLDGEIVGGVTSTQYYESLYKCLTGGTLYQASVIEINNGQIKVFIYSV